MMLSTLEWGSGPRRTVLVHGFLGSGRNLFGLARQWAAREPQRRFVLPDLTGHGSSPALPEQGDLQTIARDLLETLGTEPFDLVGHSLGGRVGLAAARIAPERISRLTLLDIAPGPVPRSISESARVLDALLAAPATAPDRETMRAALARFGLAPALAEWVLTNLRAGGEGYVWRIDAKALAAAAPRVNAEDLWDVVESRRVTIHAIRGSRSPYVTDADVARFASNGVHVATVDAGHFVHVDQPDALVSLLSAGAA